MFAMIGYLNDAHCGGRNRNPCWTCHRGHGAPTKLPHDQRRVEQAKIEIALAAADEVRSAKQAARRMLSMVDATIKKFHGEPVHSAVRPALRVM